jgi:hypothetical protein
VLPSLPRPVFAPTLRRRWPTHNGTWLYCRTCFVSCTSFSAKAYTTNSCTRVTWRYTFHATLALMIWDHFLIFDDEVRVIWQQPWNANKILYILNRYVALTQYLLQLLGTSSPDLGSPSSSTLRFPSAVMDLPQMSGEVGCLSDKRLTLA